MEKSANYWKERMKALENAQYAKTTEYYNDLQKQFRMAQNNLQMDIEHWYQRLALNNDISLAEAKKLLDKDELEEFHWTVEEYIKRGEESSLNQRWMKQLENASARVHINRLEAMKLQIQQHSEMLYQNYERGTSEFLSKIYEDGYYHTAYEIAKGTGIGSSFSRVDTNRIDKVINTPWGQDGKVFSDRIWQDKDKLVRELHTELTQSIIRGENPDMAAKRLAKRMGSKLSSARTLVYTESAAISSVAQNDSLQELGVEEFEVVETLDGHTCSTCGDMDGRHFKIKYFEIGVTAPPFHPRCRGCTCPYFNDEFSDGERIARGEDGKQYYVPENMTYNEWKDTFVNGGSKDGLTPITADDTITNKYKTAIFDYMTAISYVVNEKLRTGAALTDREQEFVNNLDAALAKMPTYEGNLQRSLYFNSADDVTAFLEDYKNGNIVKYNEFISTTKGEVYNPDGQVQIYIQNAKKGRDISSLNESEQEVLYERNTSFKVINTVEHDGKYYILMEENDAE